MGECRLWIVPYFANNALNIVFVLVGWLVRWEVSGQTVAVSSIWSKQCTTFLCSSHLDFSPIVSLESKRYNHTIVLTQLQLGRIPVFLSTRSDFHMSTVVHALSMCITWHHFEISLINWRYRFIRLSTKSELKSFYRSVWEKAAHKNRYMRGCRKKNWVGTFSIPLLGCIRRQAINSTLLRWHCLRGKTPLRTKR